MTMIYRVLADIVTLFHFGFILFVVLGGLFFVWWKRAAWIHLPVALWGVLIVWIGWTCPLTPLEQWLRRLGGEASYEGSFVMHYIVPLIYPDWLTEKLRLTIGLFVLGTNLTFYGWGLFHHLKKKR